MNDTLRTNGGGPVHPERSGAKSKGRPRTGYGGLRGEGVFAESIHALFATMSRKAGLDRPFPRCQPQPFGGPVRHVSWLCSRLRTAPEQTQGSKPTGTGLSASNAGHIASLRINPFRSSSQGGSSRLAGTSTRWSR